MPKTRSGVHGAAAGPTTQAAIKDLLGSLRPMEAKKALEEASKALAAAKTSNKRKADARTQKKAADTAKRAKAAADEAAGSDRMMRWASAAKTSVESMKVRRIETVWYGLTRPSTQFDPHQVPDY